MGHAGWLVKVKGKAGIWGSGGVAPLILSLCCRRHVVARCTPGDKQLQKYKLPFLIQSTAQNYNTVL
jgi:hypothetical protein